MISRVFSIYDSAAKAYSQPFFSAGRGTALRSFEQLVNDSQSTCNKYPADFSLHELGTFDDDTATFNMLPAPERVIDALSLMHVTAVQASSVVSMRNLEHAEEATRRG